MSCDVICLTGCVISLCLCYVVYGVMSLYHMILFVSYDLSCVMSLCHMMSDDAVVSHV